MSVQNTNENALLEKSTEQISTTEQSSPPTQKRVSRPQKPFPNYSIEESLRIPQSIAKNNAGNPWGSQQIADAISMGAKSSTYYYYTTASRDYGMTTGTGRGKTIELTPLGRKIAYPENSEQEASALLQAFKNVDIFQKVLEYYRGGDLPERRFACNTLQESFNLDASYHDEFIAIYSSNISFLKRKGAFGSSVASYAQKQPEGLNQTETTTGSPSANGELFVIMPFSEKTDQYPKGYFDEVFSSLIVPAAAQAGYVAQTANINGSDIIHKTIVNKIFNAELILADLTEHNPNVLFELGLAIAFKKKVAIIRAKGTRPIFDVDNSMRVLDYSPNLWKSTLEMDIAKLTQHIEATSQCNENSYLDIFLG